MITKTATINLSKEDMESPEDVQVVLTVNGPGGEDDSVDYTITYPKEKPSSLPDINDL